MSGCLLSAVIFLPLLGAVLLYAIPLFDSKVDKDGERSRFAGLVFSLITFLFSVVILCQFDGQSAEMQFIEHRRWIPTLGISYSIGVDGISVFLVMLTTFLMPLVMIASRAVHTKLRGYVASMLVLETAMLGTLVSLDLFLFYVFWELMLAPMYFIIGIWGGTRRIYATLKFVLYTVFGSLLMLVAIFYLVWSFAQTHGGQYTFMLNHLIVGTELSFKEELWLFAAFAVAFGIKVPIFPFHTWLPDAHVEAPTGGSVVLAGVLLKMGLYGFIRFAFPLFPTAAQTFAPWLALLAVIGIVYGALVAWAQTDIKKLVAYSSVSHLGYCVLGFVAFQISSISGSIYQMLNHGVSTGALFLLVGVLYERKHTRAIADYGGVATPMPIFAFLFLIFTLSSIALPLTNGFVGEFMILSGSFTEFTLVTIVALLGVVLGAVYMLSLYRRTMFGELDQSKNGDLQDVNFRELCTFAPLLVLVFFMGILPQPFLSTMEPTIKAYKAQVESRRTQIASRTSRELYQRGQSGSSERERLSRVSTKDEVEQNSQLNKTESAI